MKKKIILWLCLPLVLLWIVFAALGIMLGFLLEPFLSGLSFGRQVNHDAVDKIRELNGA